MGSVVIQQSHSVGETYKFSSCSVSQAHIVISMFLARYVVEEEKKRWQLETLLFP